MFPTSYINLLNVTLSTADAKMRFSTDLHGTYDLVHFHYLIARMEPTDWVPVLSNLLALLK